MAESFSYPGDAAAQKETEKSPDVGASSVLFALQVTSEKSGRFYNRLDGTNTK